MKVYIKGSDFMPRWIPLHEKVKVPVFKNTIFALRLTWRADKRLLLGYLIGYIVDSFFGLFVQSILFLKILLGIIDGSGDFKEYTHALLGFLAVSVLLVGTFWVTTYIRQTATKNVLKELNNLVFKKALELDVGYYENPEFYDKYQRATNVLSGGYFDLICSQAAQILGSVISLIMVIGTITTIDPKYLIFLFPVVFVFFFELKKSGIVYDRDLEMTSNNRVKAYIQRTVFLKDYSKDMRTSDIFSVLMVRFKKAIDGNIEILRKYGIKLFLFSMATTFFGEFLPIVGTYAYAAYQFVFTKALTVSGFSVVFSSINSVRNATTGIAQGLKMINEIAYFFQNFKDFLDFEPQIKGGEKELKEFEILEFKNVSFKYPSAKKETLKNISFKINKGETIALVGVNGAGKSTIVKLIMRFYDVTEGEILINGLNIKEYDLASLRRSYGAVFQDYKNFAVSVFENVMCHECTDEEKEKAEKALKDSGIWVKIGSLPAGGDTVITKEFEKGGIGLSGGESQKLSVARLFAKDFQFAVLDEPSSALDPIAEYNMYEKLSEITKGKTAIYISHRLSSAVLSDRILVLSGGKVIEEGTHVELMEKKGEYEKMFSLQASSYNKTEEESENEKD